MYVKDRIETTKTHKEIFRDDREKHDLENRALRYWRNKDEDLRETMNHEKAEQEKSLQKKSGQMGPI